MAAVAPKTNKAHDLGTSALRWGTLYAGEVNVDGDLTVTGAVTTTVSQTLEIEDATIQVAKGNTGDSIDFGMFGKYVEESTTKYSIIFRDNDDDGKWKIWTGFTNEPPAAGHVNIGNGNIATLVTRLETDQITGYGTNANISIEPDGTGNLLIKSDTVRVGGENEDATLTTWGAGDLTLSTNGGTNSGSIVIADGVNGDISLTPNGSGEVNISKVDIDGGAIDATVIGASTASAGNFTVLTASTINGFTANGTINFNSQAMNSVNIGSGSIDNTTIGATTQASGKFTTLTATSTFKADATAIIDVTDGSALKVRKQDSGGDVLVVSTTEGDESVNVTGNLSVSGVLSGGEQSTLSIRGGLKYDIDGTKSNATHQLSTTEHLVIADNTNNNVELELPDNPVSGQEYIILSKRGATGNTTTVVAGANGDLLDNSGSTISSLGVSNGTTLRLISDGTDWYQV